MKNPIDFNAEMEIVADSFGVHHRLPGATCNYPSQLRMVFLKAEYRHKNTLEDKLAVHRAAAEENEQNLRLLLDNMYVRVARSAGEQ